MIFVYILMNVLSGFSAIIGVGGAIGATYYLVTTGNLLWLAGATLSAIFSWLSFNLYARTGAFVEKRDYRRELSSLLQAAGGLRGRMAYFLLWLFAAVGFLAAYVVAFYYLASYPLLVLAVAVLLALFSVGMIKLAERAEKMVMEAITAPARKTAFRGAVADRESSAFETLDELYGSLRLSDRFRLYRYGVKVDYALREIGIDAGQLDSRVRPAVKILGMRDRWSPQEVATAVSLSFFEPTSFRIREEVKQAKRWREQGKLKAEHVDRFPELAVRAVQAAWGVDLRGLFEDTEDAKTFLHYYRSPEEAEWVLTRLEEITGVDIRARLGVTDAQLREER